MGVLNKPYELSVWEDTLSNSAIVEQKLCIIGAHDMVSQSRALQPKLVQNINGTNTFSFSIYYRYKDNISGEEVDNPFAQFLTNERKLKLYYDNKWYDLIIKSVKVDSTKYSYDITATDQYINELSKNGFNLTFDPQLQNNLGTIQQLATTTLEETDWTVIEAGAQSHGRYSEYVNDYDKEALVNLVVNSDFYAYRFEDNNGETDNEITLNSERQQFNAGMRILGFYSCCKSENPYFQFIYKADGSYEKDDERVITDKLCHYQVDMTGYVYGYQSSYGVSIPTFAAISNTSPFIDNDYRGARYVYSPLVQFNPTLKKYVTNYWSSGSSTSGDPDGYGFSETEYVAPNLIQNFVTNPNGFKSTAGWSVGTPNGADRGTLKNEAINSATQHYLMDDLRNGDFSASQTYIPLLEYTGSSNQYIVNTGFYDSRTVIKNLENGIQYIFRYKTNDDPNDPHIRIRVGQYAYEPATHQYTITSGQTLLDTSEATYTWGDQNGYIYKLVTVHNANFTPNEYKKQINGKVYLIISGFNSSFRIFDFQCYKAIQGSAGTWVTPEDQPTDAKIIEHYYIYNKAQIDAATVTQTRDDFNPVWQKDFDPIKDGWKAVRSVEKRRGITIKESNYYNIIQTLCENFECWAEYYIDHDANGNVLGKYLFFHNYTGDFNYAGFRYGVNLKSVQRTDDSKQIVSKLIVKQNSNEFGKDGFCTIARAPSNETGETTIYNIDYYINQGLLAAADWNQIVYNTYGAEGKDINPTDVTTNSNGYYVRLFNINKELNSLNEILKHKAVAIANANADLQLYKNGVASSKDELDEATDAFKAMFGYEWWDLSSHMSQREQDMRDFHDNIKYLVRCMELYTALQDYERNVTAAQDYYDELSTSYATTEARAEALRTWKIELNKAFYSLFYRYIQEGTWQSENYYDDEEYYIDAQSTLYNSSMPKVSYSISVLELSQLLGYEGFAFALGDRTYIEDPEFFGYDDHGYPIREAIVLTEITFNLDSPEKNNIKVQNYKSQFQDLFKKITATVQSVQYSTGAYDKAAQLADASDTEKSRFLQSGLNDAGTILQNLADQTVRLDSEGLTITDGLEQNKMLRAVGGGILLSEDGGNTWALGLTGTGINAKTITSGTLNTGTVNIMYGNEPTFKWDSFGITAYNFLNNNPLTPDFKSGVRFDRWGVYGFDINDSENLSDWHPTGISGWQVEDNRLVPIPDSDNVHLIRNHSMFELTREGVYINLGRGKTLYHYKLSSEGQVGSFTNPIEHESASTLGKIEDVLYSRWGSNGPYWNDADIGDTGLHFVKLFSIGNTSNNENLAIYDDGTIIAREIRLSDGLIFNDGTGLIKSVYCNEYTAPPADGTSWSDIPSTGPSWHQIKTVADLYQCVTYDSGAHWNGPYAITSSSVSGIEQRWGVSSSTAVVPSNWYTNRGDINDSQHKGDYVFYQENTHYSNGSATGWMTKNVERIPNDGEGTQGEHGINTATVYIYKRSTSTPGASDKPNGDLNYNFSDHELSGDYFNNWSATTEGATGTGCIWMRAATATTSDNEDTIGTNEWSSPVQLEGVNGSNGYNAATIYLYQRNVTEPTTKPQVDLVYRFSDGTFDPPGGLGQWSQTIPSENDNTLWAIAANALSNTNTDTILTTDWSDILQIEGVDGNPGTPGAAGLNQATIFIYQRAASAPGTPGPTTNYKFSDGSFTVPLGWSKTVPTGTNPCYITSGVAIGNGETATITWVTPTKFVKDGTDGEPGLDGFNTAILSVYKRTATTPDRPTATTTYDFESGSFTPPNGWSRSIPATDGNPCYISTVAAISRDTTVTVSGWSDPVKMVEDGADGADGESIYNLSLSEDSVSYGTGPVASATTISITSSVTTSITGYYGTQPIVISNYSTSAPSSSTTDEYTVVITSAGIIYTRSNNTFTISSFITDRSTLYFELYHYSTKVADITFEIIAQKQGQPGEVQSIDFSTVDTIVQNNDGTYPDTTITATANIHQGGTITPQNVHWFLGGNYLSAASGTNTINLRISLVNNAYKWQYKSTSSSSWTSTNIAPSAGIVLAAGFSSTDMSFDRETITVMPRGNTGPDGAKGDSPEIVYIYSYYADVPTTRSYPSLPQGWVSATGIPTAGQWTQSPMVCDQYHKIIYRAEQKHVIDANGNEKTGSFSVGKLEILYIYQSASTDPLQVATFYQLTNWGTAQGIKLDNDGNVYFNATYINTGTLTVGNLQQPIFSAFMGSDNPQQDPSVSIANFLVKYGAFYTPDENNNLNVTPNGSGQLRPTDTTIFFGNRDVDNYYSGSDPIKIGDSYGGEDSKLWRLIIGPNFGVLKDGTVHANNGVFSGRITATTGTIGGWTINSKSLTSGQGGMLSGSLSSSPKYQSIISNNESYIRFYCGSTTPTSAPFKVLEDGSLYATGIRVESANGVIEVGEGNFSNGVSATQIMGLLSTGASNNAGFNFSRDGIIDIIGRIQGSENYTGYNPTTITVTSGYNVTSTGPLWKRLDLKIKLDSSYLFSRYPTTFIFTITYSTNDYNGTPVIKTSQASFIYSQNYSTSNTYVTVGTKKIMGMESDPIINSVTVTPGSIGSSLTTSTRGLGVGSNLLPVTQSLSIGSYIGDGYDSALAFWYRWDIYAKTTDTNKLITRDRIVIAKTHDRSVNESNFPRIEAQSATTSGTTVYSARLYGNWYGTSGTSIASARMVKYDIQPYSSKYDRFFDELKPSTFRYIEGDSNRIHQGFILDEVGSAITAAGLDTKDIGAYCLIDPTNPNGDGGIRYTEFVSLNTWQIQLLKPRVSDLEFRCQQLEARVLELEARLNALS